MLQIENTTPFKTALTLFPDEQGLDTLYLTVRATFALEGGTLRVADPQEPIQVADTYWGAPNRSSIKYAGELHLTKPSTDVVLLGSAHAPRGRKVENLDVELGVGPVQKVVRVFGDREWAGSVLGARMSSPVPFERMPLRFERAFGGIHEVGPGEVLFEPRNPVGVGFAGNRRRGELSGLKLPNLENPAQLISSPTDRPAPTGFGYIAPSWEPRKSRVGTYDVRWRKTRAPYLPTDFQSAFFNAAPPELVCRQYLRGGEPVRVVNASPRPVLRFRLPLCEFEAEALLGDELARPVLNLETVLLKPDEDRLVLLWRGAIPCDKSALKLEWVELSLRKLELGPVGT
ncbi:DUF2169 family type VI secretion system accessory protein [Archangium lansingense]|uniref:DUF2169 family type VI secretion system accessory protein n=1 Tax=Archangium lansingense TaxID=2995310 RepID=UPI003B81893F